MTSRHAVSAVLLVLTAVLVAGCGGVRGQQVGDDDLRFFVHGRTVLPSGGMDAQVAGALAAEDGCVLLDDGASRYPVVWPAGTSVAGTDPLVLVLPSGEELHLGDRVAGGGGYLDAAELDLDIPEVCLNEFGEVAVFNPDDDPVTDPD